MKIIKLLLLTLCCVSTLALAADEKVIKFATEATYPPFEFTDATGEIKGFDIDIAKAMCAEMKATCTFSNQSFDSLIPSLMIGKFDALIAALGVTPERQKQVDFSHSYYEPSASFVAALDKHYTITQINGKTVGVQKGSTFQSYLQDKYENRITVKTYASAQEAFLDLRAGRVDVVLVDTPIANAWLKENNKQYAVVEKPIIDHQYFGTGYGIAVRKDNVDLLHAFNLALGKIKANGTYHKIVAKYFGN